MSFQCLDCGHKGKQAAKGACPACGSFNLKTIGARKLEPEKTKKSLTLKSIAMTALWVYFGYLIFQKFFGE